MTAARQVATGAFAGTIGATAPKAGLTSAGTTQAGATLIQHEFAEFGTVGASSGARLPTPAEIGGLQAGDNVVVANNGANALLVYPPVGGKIGTAAANAALSIPAGKAAKFFVSVASPLNWVAILSA